MVRKKTIYKVIKYVMIIIAYIIAFKTIFHDFNQSIYNQLLLNNLQVISQKYGRNL